MRLPSATTFALDPAAATPRARIEKAAHELEAQFAQMLIKSMRSASFGDPLMGESSSYRDMYDQQLSRELTSGRGLGLTPMIVRQLEGASARTPAAAPGQALPLPGLAPAGLPLPGLVPGGIPLPGMAPGGLSLPGMAPGDLPLAPASLGVSLSLFDPAMSRLAAPAEVDFDGTAECPPDPPLDCSSPEAFVHSIWPQAQRAAAELGVPAKALVAQAALETGWGRRLAGREGVTSHNLFGIKASGKWTGERMSSATHEFVDGVRRSERADFRAYGSTSDSFADYTRLISGSRYAAARGAGDDTARFASALQHAGYATDPNYAAKITAIANGPTLRRALAALPEPSAALLASSAPVTANAIKG